MAQLSQNSITQPCSWGHSPGPCPAPGAPQAPQELCFVSAGPKCLPWDNPQEPNPIKCCLPALTLPGASVSEVQGKGLAVKNQREGRFSSKLGETELSWQFLESHESLLFLQLFTIPPNYDVLGTKSALGFEAAVSVICCQHSTECTGGSAGQGWGTCGTGLSQELWGTQMFYPHVTPSLMLGQRSISQPQQ